MPTKGSQPAALSDVGETLGGKEEERQQTSEPAKRASTYYVAGAEQARSSHWWDMPVPFVETTFRGGYCDGDVKVRNQAR